MNQQPSPTEVLREFGTWLQAWAEFVAAQAETGEAVAPPPPSVASAATPPAHWLADVAKGDPPTHWLARVQQAQPETTAAELPAPPPRPETAVPDPLPVPPHQPTCDPVEDVVVEPVETAVDQPPTVPPEPRLTEPSPAEQQSAEPQPAAQRPLAALTQWLADMQAATETLATQGTLPEPPRLVQQRETAVDPPPSAPPLPPETAKPACGDAPETAVAFADEPAIVPPAPTPAAAPPMPASPAVVPPTVVEPPKTAVGAARFGVAKPKAAHAPRPEPVAQVAPVVRLVLPPQQAVTRATPLRQPAPDLAPPLPPAQPEARPAPPLPTKSAVPPPRWVEAPQRPVLAVAPPQYGVRAEREGEKRPFFPPQTNHWPELPPERPIQTPTWQHEARQQQRRQRLDAEQRGVRWNE